MIPFSVLDLAPVTQGSGPSDALRNSRDLARHTERLGYKRFWLAEHHGMPGIASAATAVAIGYVAEGTSTIRVGAGGIMLPNHAPMVIAEQFGTLDALYPGRIDLGLGRAPGSDPLTARALRRDLKSDPNAFPQDVIELMAYFRHAEPVRAVPGYGARVPIYILGSSLFGAQVAAALGLPYAFASHFAPAEMMEAIALYRESFQPSAELEKPYVMLGFNMFAAESDEEAHLLMSSRDQAFVALRTGNPGLLMPPVENYRENLDPRAKAMLQTVLSATAVGNYETVKRQTEEFIAKTRADELILTAQIFDHDKRKRSYEIAARLMDLKSAA
ncbi:alkane 1-monooxygenase [Terrihabitans soli]|uniref:Luciferase-like monooxygenase n=1 Tax=Terrihabitans soli TaxID=708113 RepID=A0A6S6QXT0_9HYPH|nr:LLM class flavin-dependent oxidoreductase [Terrihabitans soli]BCJ92335.1 alkane 1-monooxygenase [Terrihabitans soli]